MKRTFIPLLLILIIAGQTAAQYETDTIRNFMRVNTDFCTGGQPRLEHLEKLKAEGVKAIINLRTPGEHRAAEEEAKAKEVGLRYFNIPVVYTAPKEEQVTEFLKITDDAANRPAFIHCTAAIRVGAFWMIRRVMRDGLSIQEAEAEAKKVGLVNAPHLVEFALDYIAKHGKAKTSQGSPAQGSTSQNAQATPVLEGLDPVMLVKGKEAQGEMNISVTRGQFQYLFANAENRSAFEKAPDRYEIQLGGACARMGSPVTGNPDLYTVYKERIYIFGSAECKKAFEAAPEKYLETEEAKITPSPEAIKKGRALVEKAVQAMGGASKLDWVTNYQESRMAVRRSPQGDQQIKYSLTVVFPGQSRQETIAPGWQQAIVITPTESFGFNPSVSRPARTLPDMMRAEYEKQLMYNPLIILKNRNESSFKAVAVGAGKVGEIEVEQLEVEMNNFRVRLAIYPKTGRIMSLSYRGRGPGGVVGQVERIYSEFNNVDGLTLPFKISGAFNGQADERQSSTVESIIVNGKVAPAVFEKPQTTGAQ